MPPIKSHPVLEKNKEEIEAIVDAASIQIVGAKQLKQILRRIIELKFYPVDRVTVDDLLYFLTHRSRLHRVDFRTPRIETLYYWGVVDPYALMPILRPNGYYTHLTALFLHGLVSEEPTHIYYNSEQPARASSGTLEQARIDNAFKKQQRITTARTEHQGRVYWLVSGKQTGSYGVILATTPSDTQVSCTDLERTLIDVTVRPAYAGGVNSVLQAFRLAHPRVSIHKLAQTLRSMKYVYPYHQSVGYYIDTAGNYSESDCLEFLAFQPFNFDFYLDYRMANLGYSPKWRIYYSTDITV